MPTRYTCRQRETESGLQTGIRPGAVILEVDRQPVKDVAAMKRLVDRHANGTPLVMLLQRQDATLHVAV